MRQVSGGLPGRPGAGGKNQRGGGGPGSFFGMVSCGRACLCAYVCVCARVCVCVCVNTRVSVSALDCCSCVQSRPRSSSSSSSKPNTRGTASRASPSLERHCHFVLPTAERPTPHLCSRVWAPPSALWVVKARQTLPPWTRWHTPPAALCGAAGQGTHHHLCFVGRQGEAHPATCALWVVKARQTPPPWTRWHTPPPVLCGSAGQGKHHHPR